MTAWKGIGKYSMPFSRFVKKGLKGLQYGTGNDVGMVGNGMDLHDRHLRDSHSGFDLPQPMAPWDDEGSKG